MKIFGKWRSFISGLCLALSGAAWAAMPPPIPVTVTPATGIPGATVQPVFSFDVTGFEFASFDLILSYTSPLLSLDLGNSSVTVNGVSSSWASVLPFLTTASGAGSYEIHGFALEPALLTGPILLRPAFTISAGAPLGATEIQIEGSIGEQPLIGERSFSSVGIVTVTAVPEPEVWLMFLGGLGMLALRRARLAR